MVDQIITTMRQLVASGMDWQDIAELVAEEKKKGNSLAMKIVGLKLNVGMVSVLLRDFEVVSDDEDDSSSSDEDSDDDEDEEEDESNKVSARKRQQQQQQQRQKTEDSKFLTADIDFYSTAYANARRYYDQKRTAAQKQEKTLQATSKAYKSASKKIQQDLSAKTSNQHALSSGAVNINLITKIRKPYWFEKFYWFISSENYLVIGGRDAQQNELLVKRHLEKGDIYVHADLHGASSIIIKNLRPTNTDSGASESQSQQPSSIPPMTLHQAGTLSVCCSKAWDSKIVTSAYWVYDWQVSKTAPTGEYLTTGSFMIRGTKNYLPPVQLVLGFGVLFRIDDTDPEAVARHKGERDPWARRGSAIDGDYDANDDHNEQKESNEMLQELVDSDSDEDEDDVEDNNNPEGNDGERDEDDKEEGKNDINDEDDEEEEDEDVEFPDTQLDLQPASRKPNVNEATVKAMPEKKHHRHSQDGQTETNSVISTDKNTKHLSARERRMLKKQKSYGDHEKDKVEEKDNSDDDEDDSEQEEKPARASPEPKSVATKNKQKQKQQQEQQQQQQQQQKQVRGKKGKLKKMKEKYKDQDEEDRELMMEILGSNKMSKKQLEQQAKEEKEREKVAALAARKAKQESKNQKKVGMKQVAESMEKLTVATDKPNDDDDKMDQDVDEDMDDGGEDTPNPNGASADSSNFAYLDYLTGQPHPDDTLLYAIPICAPWNAMQKYKYKVKLLPGSLKKGKAAKTAVHSFLTSYKPNPKADNRRAGGKPGEGAFSAPASEEDGKEKIERERQAKLEASTAREKDLIRCIKDEEMVLQMVGKCKVMGNVELADSGKKKGGAGKRRKPGGNRKRILKGQ